MNTSPRILKSLPLLAFFFLQRNTSATETDNPMAPMAPMPPMPTMPASDASSPLSALHGAARDGKVAEIQARLAAGDPVDVRDDLDRTPLHYAAAAGHIPIADLLLNHGADPNARATGGMTPLHFAAMLGRPEMAGLLARHGARTDARTTSGMTPLHLAADDKVVNALALAGADLNAKTVDGMTPLHTARQSSVARALLDHGADLRIRTPQGRTAMELAAIESLEPAGLSVHSVMLGRLRGLVGEMNVTLTNITDGTMRGLALEAHSPACDIEVQPAQVSQLLPGQNVGFSLVLTRLPTLPEGEHPIFLSMTSDGKKLGQTDLKVDTRLGVTLEDRGMIRLAKGQMRPAPSRWFYLVYTAVPLLVIAAWLFFRRR
jgi:hypothetical protein